MILLVLSFEQRFYLPISIRVVRLYNFRECEREMIYEKEREGERGREKVSLLKE